MHHPELLQAGRAASNSPVSPLGLDGLPFQGLVAPAVGGYAGGYGTWPSPAGMPPKAAEGLYPSPAFQVQFQQQQPMPQATAISKAPFVPTPGPFQLGAPAHPLRQNSPGPAPTPPNPAAYLQQLAMGGFQHPELLSANFGNPVATDHQRASLSAALSLTPPTAPLQPTHSGLGLNPSVLHALGSTPNTSRASTPPLATCVSPALIARALANAQALGSPQRAESPGALDVHAAQQQAQLAEKLASYMGYALPPVDASAAAQPGSPRVAAAPVAAVEPQQSQRDKSERSVSPESDYSNKPDDDEDAIAQAAASALEAAVKQEQASMKLGGGAVSGVQRSNSLRNVRDGKVVPASIRRGSARSSGRLRRCESMGDLWKGSHSMARVGSGACLSEADKVVRDAATALEEAVAREQQQQSHAHAPKSHLGRTKAARGLIGHHTQSLGSVSGLNNTLSLPEDLLGLDGDDVYAHKDRGYEKSSHWVDIPHNRGRGRLNAGAEHDDLSAGSDSTLNSYGGDHHGGGHWISATPSARSSQHLVSAHELHEYATFAHGGGHGGATPAFPTANDLEGWGAAAAPVPYGSSLGSGSGLSGLNRASNDSQGTTPSAGNSQHSQSSKQYDGLFLDDDEDFSKMLGELSMKSLLLDQMDSLGLGEE